MPAPLDPITRRRAVADPGTLTPAGIIALQRTVGNGAVRHLIRPKRGDDGTPGDRYEQEVYRFAAGVHSTPAASVSNPVRLQAEDDDLVQASPLAGLPTPAVQRQDEEDEERVQASGLIPTVQRQDAEEDLIQAKSARRAESSDGSFEAGASLESRLAAHRGGGQPLPDDLRSELEPKFGSDFSAVRVHTGPESVQMNRELGAQAFTHGTDIYFGEGKYAPGSLEGKKLLAHELTHVVQQTGGRPLQRKAESALRSVQPATIGATGGRIQRGLLDRLRGRKRQESPPEPAANPEPERAPEAAAEGGKKSRTEVALGYLKTFFNGIGLILKEGTLRSLAAGAQIFEGSVYVAESTLHRALGMPGAVVGGSLIVGGAIAGGVLAGVGTLVSALVSASAAVVGGLVGGLVLSGAKLADLITSVPARLKSWWQERKKRKRQEGKTANVPLQEKASNVAVKLNKRLWKIERYFSFQQMDYDTLSQHAREMQEGLPPELASAAESYGKRQAGRDGTVSPTEARELVPEERAAEPLVEQLAKLATLFKYREESDLRVKKAAHYHANTSRYYQFALELYDKIVAAVKGGQDPGPLYRDDVDRAWDLLETAEGYRQELKADKARVKAEASRDDDKYGMRSESFVRKQGKKIFALLKNTVVSVATLGRETVRSRTVGGGYRVEVETVKRTELIREAVTRAMDIWTNTANQGAGLGAPRLYAVLKGISEILGLLKPAFTAIGVISTGLSVLFSVVGLLPVAGGFAGVAALCTAINLALTLAKLALDLLLAIWSGIASAVARDPRSRINTAMKSRQQAVEVASGLVTGAASGFGVAMSGGIENAFNPATAYGRIVDKADPTGVVMGANDRPKTIIPGESGVGVVDKVNSKITIDHAIRYGGLASGKAGIKLGKTVAYPMGGSHLLEQAEDQESRAFENIRGKGPELDDGGFGPEGEDHEAEGVGRMAEAQERSAEVVARVENMIGEAEGAPEKTRRKGKFRRAVEGAASLLATITIIPAFIKDLVTGIRAAWRDRKKNGMS